jgi:hypothetical protein
MKLITLTTSDGPIVVNVDAIVTLRSLVADDSPANTATRSHRTKIQLLRSNIRVTESLEEVVSKIVGVSRLNPQTPAVDEQAAAELIDGLRKAEREADDDDKWGDNG